MTLVLVILGGAIGAPARYLTDRAVQRGHGGDFPWGTLTVNVAGSFVLGLVSGLTTSDWALALVGTGFCGAFTTYSTFGFETVRLAERREARLAAANVVLSLAAGLVAVAVGWWLGSWVG